MAAAGIGGIATGFLALASSGKVREAFERHVADAFTHHNPWFPGDRESLLVAMEQSAASEPNKAFTVKQVIAAGERVAVLSHVEREQAGLAYAVVHVFRFEGERIAEMWDVVQEIPQQSPNALGMF
jgi:predicted SnoaL-like aldol condensation-catalyzing enzyme